MVDTILVKLVIMSDQTSQVTSLRGPGLTRLMSLEKREKKRLGWEKLKPQKKNVAGNGLGRASNGWDGLMRWPCLEIPANHGP